MKRPFGIFNILSICIIAILTNSCKEKDCHEDGTCAPDYRKMPLGEAKDYIYSLPGSYWIYLNTATGDLDTQICTGFVCDTVIKKGNESYSKHITIEYERIRRTIHSSFTKIIYLDQTVGYNPNEPRDLKAVVDRDGVSSYIKGFFFPIISNEKISTGGSVTTCKGVDSSLMVQGKSFSNVGIFEVDIDAIWENSPPFTSSKYYWAKDVGLIKRSANQKPDNWELIDYKIIN